MCLERLYLIPIIAAFNSCEGEECIKGQSILTVGPQCSYKHNWQSNRPHISLPLRTGNLLMMISCQAVRAADGNVPIRTRPSTNVFIQFNREALSTEIREKKGRKLEECEGRTKRTDGQTIANNYELCGGHYNGKT